jgi:hypothetical protein
MKLYSAIHKFEGNDSTSNIYNALNLVICGEDSIVISISYQSSTEVLQEIP